MNNYQNYEEYMRNVLGYSPYVQNNYGYEEMQQEDLYNYQNTPNTQDVSAFYPEIYKMVYPMVCKICNTNYGKELNKELLSQMVDEIYKNVEPEENASIVRVNNIPLKNGDVRNPNAKEPEINVKETRHNNFLLRDLIQILLLREWQRPTRPQPRPPFPHGGNMPPFMRNTWTWRNGTDLEDLQ